MKATWPKDFASIDIKSSQIFRNDDRDHHGTIKAEVPLAKRHMINVNYALKERQDATTGFAVVEYNKNKVLDGKYNCKSEIRDNNRKDTVDITLENLKYPFGVVYVHQWETSDDNMPLYVSLLFTLTDIELIIQLSPLTIRSGL